MSSFGILRAQLIIGALVMLAAAIMLPVGIMMGDPSLLLNPYIIGTVIVGMLMFGAFAYFLFMRPYFIYRKLPEVLAETDGEYLYVHGKREAVIPLSELGGTQTFVHLPFLFSNELVAVLFTHLLSEKYGDLDLDVPGYGSYKLRFVANVYATANELIAFINASVYGF
jgi:hypothetical protein